MPNRTTARPPITDPTMRPVEGGLDLSTAGDVVASDAANGDDDVPDIGAVDEELDVNDNEVVAVDADVEVDDDVVVGGITTGEVVVCWDEVVVVPVDTGEVEVELAGATFMKSRKNWVPELTVEVTTSVWGVLGVNIGDW
jgi:hypothetical protein